jgi:hypothetical protein
MNYIKYTLIFFLLPVLAILSYPPKMLSGGLWVIVFVVALFVGLTILLWLGKLLALTFSILLQGLNVVVRMMMFFSNSVSSAGVADWTYIIFSLIGLTISFYLIIRLDRPDVHARMH